MNEINKTLYIPLYGKSYVGKKGIILQDKKAEEIWEKEKFPLAEGKEFWHKYLACFPKDKHLLLEFMPHHAVEELPEEVEALRKIIGGTL